ncbi:response regulator [Marinibactrum halimedae]|uniref:histidine kinase n=1 Tax=Marinibactrum halimedae TaxID=1444977 RepID=A0AA37T4T0_9GAMM|nr:response regulator [Marinibactrum halimedae]MCD9458213.1 response regulator [Marinibactrum halimedae]GLS27158.1 hybrid sensor histidine kinase/response regulator [Marinibactrum halimedae]
MTLVIMVFLLSENSFANSKQAQAASIETNTRDFLTDRISLRFQRLSVEDGLPTQSLKDIVEYRNDIWLASYSGVVRYDGYTLKTYSNEWNNPKSLHNNLTTKLFVDGQNQLWVCGAGAIQRFNSPSDDFTVFPFSTAKNKTHSTDQKEAVCASIAEDEEGKLWVATTEGLLVWHSDDEPLTWVESTRGNSYIDVAIGPDNTVFIASVNKGEGLFQFDTNTHTLTQLKQPTIAPDEQYGIYAISSSPTGKFWAASYGAGPLKVNNQSITSGLVSLETTTLKLNDTSHARALNKAYVQDLYFHDNNVWISTRNQGLFLLDHDNTLKKIEINTDINRPNQSLNIQDIHIDKEGIIWLATFDGLYYAELRTQAAHWNNVPGFSNIGDVQISDFAENDDDFWISTIGKGILKIPNHRTSQNIPSEHLSIQNPSVSGLRSNRIRSMLITRKDQLWVATDQGTQFLPSTLPTSEGYSFQSLQDRSSNIITRYSSTLFEDRQQRVWVGYQDSVAVYDDQGFEIQRFDTLANGPIMSITQTSDGMIWIGSLAGGVAYIHESLSHSGRLISDTTKSGESQPSRNKAPYNQQVFAIANTPNTHQLILGTSTGLQRIDTQTGQRLPPVRADSGLGKILSIERVDEHLYWVSTETQLAIYDFEQNRVLTHFEKHDGLQPGAFVHGASYLSQSGTLYFGGKRGLNYFSPTQLKKNAYLATTTLSAEFFDTNNDTPAHTISAKGLTNTVEVSSTHNNVSFEFASSSKANPAHNRFRFQLLGYDSMPQVLPAGQRQVRYTNLPPGQYTATAQASNNSGVWGVPQSFRFYIETPIWMRWYAWLTYGALNVGFMFFILKLRQRHIIATNRKLQERVDSQTSELESKNTQLEQLLHYKEEFMANVAHELKTPLTLMLGTVKSQREGQEKASLMQRFIHRMNVLIDSMIALSTPYEKTGSRTTQRFYAHEWVAFYCDAYARLLTPQRLQLQQNVSAVVEVEKDTLDTIITNLLNNAVKYSPNDSAITVETYVKTASSFNPSPSLFWSFSVTNTGNKIHPEKLNAIFERYVRLGEHNNTFGLGLGLPLVKQLSEQCGGGVTIDSNEQHTRVTVHLPVASESKESLRHSKKTPVVSINNIDTEQINEAHIAPLLGLDVSSTHPCPEPPSHAVEQYDDKETNLIYCVDDNEYLLAQLNEQLSPHFEVNTFQNPITAFEHAQQTLPDLIISDVMMPQLSGFELVRRCRRHELLSHIPIILLTAKNDRASHNEGLLSLADDYITKPYEPQLLRVKVDALIQLRSLLRRTFSTSISTPISTSIGVSSSHTATANDSELTPNDASKPSIQVMQNCAPQEREFLQRVIQKLKKNLSDNAYGVKELSQDLHLSESQLRRKLKGISGYTPQEILKLLRIETAAHFITSGHSLKEAAFSAGFSSPSHMGSSFKAYFGLTPKQYAEQSHHTQPIAQPTT